METVKLLTKLGKTYHSYFGFQSYDGKIYKRYNNEESGELDYNKTIKESQMSVKYKTVIVKFNGKESKFWYSKPKSQWYNEPITYFKKPGLPFLNTKNYIEVTDPYMCVTISSKKKGSHITIDDILFATRALASDGTRTVEKYKLINETDDILIIEPIIDNFST